MDAQALKAVLLHSFADEDITRLTSTGVVSTATDAFALKRAREASPKPDLNLAAAAGVNPNDTFERASRKLSSAALRLALEQWTTPSLFTLEKALELITGQQNQRSKAMEIYTKAIGPERAALVEYLRKAAQSDSTGAQVHTALVVLGTNGLGLPADVWQPLAQHKLAPSPRSARVMWLLGYYVAPWIESPSSEDRPSTKSSKLTWDAATETIAVTGFSSFDRPTAAVLTVLSTCKSKDELASLFNKVQGGVTIDFGGTNPQSLAALHTSGSQISAAWIKAFETDGGLDELAEHARSIIKAYLSLALAVEADVARPAGAEAFLAVITHASLDTGGADFSAVKEVLKRAAIERGGIEEGFLPLAALAAKAIPMAAKVLGGGLAGGGGGGLMSMLSSMPLGSMLFGQKQGGGSGGGGGPLGGIMNILKMGPLGSMLFGGAKEAPQPAAEPGLPGGIGMLMRLLGAQGVLSREAGGLDVVGNTVGDFIDGRYESGDLWGSETGGRKKRRRRKKKRRGSPPPEAEGPSEVEELREEIDKLRKAVAAIPEPDDEEEEEADERSDSWQVPQQR